MSTFSLLSFHFEQSWIEKKSFFCQKNQKNQKKITEEFARICRSAVRIERHLGWRRRAWGRAQKRCQSPCYPEHRWPPNRPTIIGLFERKQVSRTKKRRSAKHASVPCPMRRVAWEHRRCESFRPLPRTGKCRTLPRRQSAWVRAERQCPLSRPQCSIGSQWSESMPTIIFGKITNNQWLNFDFLSRKNKKLLLICTYLRNNVENSASVGGNNGNATNTSRTKANQHTSKSSQSGTYLFSLGFSCGTIALTTTKTTTITSFNGNKWIATSQVGQSDALISSLLFYFYFW